MPEAVVVACARSPIGRARKGSLVDMRPDDLAAQMVGAALDKVPALDPHSIDDLLMGCAQPAGESGFNIGRAVAVQMGCDDLPGTTVVRACASSLQTSRMAFHAIRAGEGRAFVSAGVETVSRYVHGRADGGPETHNPAFAAAEARTAQLADSRTSDWHDPRDDGELPDLYIAMGQTAENLALSKQVGRIEMDEFGVRSQTLAEKARVNGFWQADITPVRLPDGTLVASDDCPRAGVTYEAVAALSPAFRQGGRVTAGNCCPLNDGAAALVIMSDELAGQLAIEPLARIVATGVSALSPEIMGYGPVEATRRALDLAGMTIADIELVEMNEAFAAQVIPCYSDLGIELDRLNVNGGAIAVGHPFGMTGARLTATLIHSLQFHDKHLGLVTMCVGGGQGMAMIVERLS